MHATPKISVVLPVYNSEKYLEKAINSILNQTFNDFELIVVNDGSTDKSVNIIKKFMLLDKRIKLIDRNNKGIVSSLNEAINLSKGEYIARMDADDICLPSRFKDQIEYMKKNDLDLCGTWVEPFNEVKKHNISRFPVNHSDIVVSSLFYCCINHPSVMVRSKVFDKLKYEDIAAEDYYLWYEMIANNFKMGNLPKVLLKYRLHNEQITRNKADALKCSAEVISKKIAAHFGNLELDTHAHYSKYLKNNEPKTFIKISNNLSSLLKKHNASLNCKHSILSRIYLKSKNKSPALYLTYFIKSFSFRKNIRKEAELFTKSFITYFKNTIRKKQ